MAARALPVMGVMLGIGFHLACCNMVLSLIGPVCGTAYAAPPESEVSDPLGQLAELSGDLVAERGAKLGLDRAEVSAFLSNSRMRLEIRSMSPSSDQGSVAKFCATPRSSLGEPEVSPHFLPASTVFRVDIHNPTEEPLFPILLEYLEGGKVTAHAFPRNIAPDGWSTQCLSTDDGTESWLLRVVGVPVHMPAIQDWLEEAGRAAEDVSASSRNAVAHRAVSTLVSSDATRRVVQANLAIDTGGTLRADTALAHPRSKEDTTRAPGFMRDMLLRTMPPKTGVLVYLADGQKMDVLWYEAGRPLVRTTLPVSVDEVGQVAAQLSRSLGEQKRVRAPISRSVDLSVVRGPMQDVATSIASASSGLLPVDIQRRMGKMDHIVIVPSHSLGTTAWYAVEVMGRPLVSVASVSIAPDLSALLQAPRAWNSDFQQPLLVGNPTLGGDDYPNWRFPDLPGAEAEVNAIGMLLKTPSLTADKATHDAVIAAAPTSDLIYLASHGISSASDPMWGSFVALSGGGWTTAEVLATDLKEVRLTVLSACQTGLGLEHTAGTIGLSRAYFQAGVPRVVMSLWNVDDQGTQALMTRFFTHLADAPPSEALRRAANELRKEGADPSVWASFMVMGTPN